MTGAWNQRLRPLGHATAVNSIICLCALLSISYIFCMGNLHPFQTLSVTFCAVLTFRIRQKWNFPNHNFQVASRRRCFRTSNIKIDRAQSLQTFPSLSIKESSSYEIFELRACTRIEPVTSRTLRKNYASWPGSRQQSRVYPTIF